MSLRIFSELFKWGGKTHPKWGWHYLLNWVLGLNKKERASWILAFIFLFPNHECSVISYLTPLLLQLKLSPTMVDCTHNMWAQETLPSITLFLTTILLQWKKNNHYRTLVTKSGAIAVINLILWLAGLSNYFVWWMWENLDLWDSEFLRLL